jgi:hypothetical protein
MTVLTHLYKKKGRKKKLKLLEHETDTERFQNLTNIKVGDQTNRIGALDFTQPTRPYRGISK